MLSFEVMLRVSSIIILITVIILLRPVSFVTGFCARNEHVDMESNVYYKSFLHLETIGVAQCMRMCKRYRLCVKILHDREQLTCDLMMVSAEEGNMTSLVYVQDVSMGKSGCSQDSCSDLEMCVDKKDGGHVCIQVLDIDLPDVCPTADWMPFNGKCYYYNQTKTDENGLTGISNSMNSTFIRIDDAEVQYFLKSEVDRLGLETMWIGLKKVNDEWVWGPNDPTTFVEWGPGEPDTLYEHCAFISKQGLGNGLCTHFRRIGCELPFNIPSR